MIPISLSNNKEVQTRAQKKAPIKLNVRRPKFQIPTWKRTEKTFFPLPEAPKIAEFVSTETHALELPNLKIDAVINSYDEKLELDNKICSPRSQRTSLFPNSPAIINRKTANFQKGKSTIESLKSFSFEENTNITSKIPQQPSSQGSSKSHNFFSSSRSYSMSKNT